MTAPFAKLVNNKHDNLVLNAKQDQAIELVNSRRKETPVKKKANWLPEIIIAIVFIIALAVAFYVATAEHRGDPSINGAPISEMSISEQLTAMEEARYNDN